MLQPPFGKLRRCWAEFPALPAAGVIGLPAGHRRAEVGEKSVEARALARPELFFWRKVMSYYPLHAAVSTAFAPMFVAVERSYGTPASTSAFRAVLNFSMLQARPRSTWRAAVCSFSGG